MRQLISLTPQLTDLAASAGNVRHPGAGQPARSSASHNCYSAHELLSHLLVTQGLPQITELFGRAMDGS